MPHLKRIILRKSALGYGLAKLFIHRYNFPLDLDWILNGIMEKYEESTKYCLFSFVQTKWKRSFYGTF